MREHNLSLTFQNDALRSLPVKTDSEPRDSEDNFVVSIASIRNGVEELQVKTRRLERHLRTLRYSRAASILLEEISHER